MDNLLVAPPQLHQAGLQLALDHDEDAHSDSPSPFRKEQDLTKILTQYDPERMKLTRQENQHALEIKEMVEGMPDLDNLSDLMYAQLAIVCKDNVENAIERCYAMQEFKQEYIIVDTVQQGFRHLQANFALFPEQMLSFSFAQSEGTYTFVHDFTKFEPKAFTSAEMAEDWLKVMYYSHILFFPDIESIRKGIVFVVECQGMGLRREVLRFLTSFFSQFLSYYPMNGQCRLFHTGAMFNVIISMLRALLPQQMRESFQIGLQIDGTLGDIFLVPTVQQANQKMLRRMQTALQQRYHNEQHFSLITV